MREYYTPTLKNRAQPGAAWIESIRQQFPTETTLDEVLTKKLRNRSRTVEHKTDFSDLETRLFAYLKKATGQDDIIMANLHRLSGGASKEQFTFNLTWNQESGTRSSEKLILRMDPSESIVETHRLRESQMLNAMWGEVPVPKVYWTDPVGEDLGHPFLIAGFLEGTVQPEGGDKASGLGMFFEPSLRLDLKEQFVQYLAKIHTIDWRNKGLTSYDSPRENHLEANEWSLGWWERVWHEDAVEAHPIVENAALWLRENMQPVEKPVIVHGDYRSGNFMYSDDHQINAVLDWELSHIGDFHEDLSYTTCQILGTPMDDGSVLTSGLLSKSEFLDKYQHYSGNTVDPKRLFYFDVFSYYKVAVISVATSSRAAYGRKTHLDSMMNLLSGFGYTGISALQRLLDQGS